MLSSVNAFGGLSSAELLTLFGASSSSSSESKAANTAQSLSLGVSGSSVNDPADAIKAILAQAEVAHAQLEISLGDSGSVITAQAAYEEQTNGSNSLMSASVTISSSGAAQQIANAVSYINDTYAFWTQTNLDNGSSVSNPLTVTAADAVNITMSNGAVSATAVQGAVFPNGLPSAASIQAALNNLKTEDEGTGWNGVEAGAYNPEITTAANPESMAKDVTDSWFDSVDASFTLVQVPVNALYTPGGGNLTTFDSNGRTWALVLPQGTVSVTVSDTQVRS